MEWSTARPGPVAWSGGTVTTDLRLSAHRSRAVNLDVNAVISNSQAPKTDDYHRSVPPPKAPPGPPRRALSARWGLQQSDFFLESLILGLEPSTAARQFHDGLLLVTQEGDEFAEALSCKTADIITRFLAVRIACLIKIRYRIRS